VFSRPPPFAIPPPPNLALRVKISPEFARGSPFVGAQSGQVSPDVTRGRGASAPYSQRGSSAAFGLYVEIALIAGVVFAMPFTM